MHDDPCFGVEILTMLYMEKRKCIRVVYIDPLMKKASEPHILVNLLRNQILEPLEAADLFLKSLMKDLGSSSPRPAAHFLLFPFPCPLFSSLEPLNSSGIVRSSLRFASIPQLFRGSSGKNKRI